MPKDDKPRRQAKLVSFPTGAKIESPSTVEASELLSRIAGRAMVAGADPSALVSPDHTLLLCCDAVVMMKRQHDQLEDRWRGLWIGSAEHDRAQEEWRMAGRAVRRLLLKVAKLKAQTPAGLFGKASAVSRAGTTAAAVAVSLADDLLASPELRRAIWPADRQ